MVEYQYEFSSTLKAHDFGRMAYTVVYAPKKLARQLRLSENPRLRIDGQVNGFDFHGAFNPAGDGKYYLILSKKFCKAARLKVGDKTWVCFDIANQDSVDVPRELELALAANQNLLDTWNNMSPGKRRGYAYRVASAKRRETRERRIEEVMDNLSSHKDR